MIARYKIPEVFLPGFKALAKFSVEDSVEVAKVLQNFQVGTTRDKFRQNVIESLNNSEAGDVAEAIFSTGALLAVEHHKVLALAALLTKSVQAQLPDISLTEAEAFEKNLSIILEHSKNLRITFKAYNLLSENLNSFVASRIVTDFRPVFDDEKLQAEYGVIIHQLKLSYDCASENKEFFISLTADELIAVRDQITRALEKEEFIKNNLREFQFLTIKE